MSKSNLVTHAERELDIIGEEGFVKAGILKIMQAFADMGHSGSSAFHTADVLDRLFRLQPLTPLTDDPTEWMRVPGGDEKCWQNVRDSRAFSYNGGRSYYLVDEGPGIMHFSEKHQ